MSTIFIQIASYRDPQLVPTLDDCIAKAKFPENLRFGICWQHDSEESLGKYKKDKRFRIVDVPFEKSKGACWARNQLQKKYKNEKYTLQLDSHHRFIQDWDVELIKMLESVRSTKCKKPVLTSYISSWDPDNDPKGRVSSPWGMNFDRFTPEGVVFFLPATIPNHENLKKPVPARFYSAHFCFADGCFATEIQHDPDYYFHGEEISIAVRAFTHGYDLFHPHKVIAWHEYTRKGRTKHWDDDKNWYEKNTKCHKRNRILLGMEENTENIDFGIYGIGKKRTIKDYEKYSGVQFKTRAVQQYTLDKNYPPNPSFKSEKAYQNSFLKIFRHCVDIQYSQVPENDYEFWVVAFHGKNGENIFRKDADANEIKRMMKDPDKYCKIWREFNAETLPAYVVVWPFSKSKGWCDQIKQIINR
jgi:hypothetical protein